MNKKLVILILLANLLALNCHEEDLIDAFDQDNVEQNEKPSYSFSYGVSDANTGDIKTVWEAKEGDTVKGHYSVLGPDGTMRTVQYSASPNTGFKAVVNNENTVPEPQIVNTDLFGEKSMRDYAKYYDFDEHEEEYFERKRNKRPYDSYRDYSKKKPHYGFDMEPSEYTHSITIKHPHDESSPDGEAHSHVGYSFDPNCKTKTKKESNDNKDHMYAGIVDYDLNKHKYPYQADSYRDTFESYNGEPSNFAFEKIKPYGSYKPPRYEEPRPSSSTKYNYPALADMPVPDKYYVEDLPPRPKKKTRPAKVPEYLSDDLDDYILVPKKKYKPMRVEPNDYRQEPDDDYERPSFSSYGDEQEDRFRPVRGSNGQKEVIKKVVKKRKPPAVINLLDIFDI